MKARNQVLWENMYPDLGIALIEREELKPFRLTVLNDLTLAEDRVLGWMITGLTQQFFTSAVDSNPAPIIQEPMMFSIYLGRGSKSRAETILGKLQTSGLVIVPREDKKYLVTNGKEWVVPLQYLKNY